MIFFLVQFSVEMSWTRLAIELFFTQRTVYDTHTQYNFKPHVFFCMYVYSVWIQGLFAVPCDCPLDIPPFFLSFHCPDSALSPSVQFENNKRKAMCLVQSLNSCLVRPPEVAAHHWLPHSSAQHCCPSHKPQTPPIKMINTSVCEEHQGK